MLSEMLLTAWTVAGLAWWTVAYGLVARDRGTRGRTSGSIPQQTLSIFKPLPPLGAGGLQKFTAGLESFTAQLDENGELLLGIHEADREQVAPFLQELRAKFPEARMETIFRSGSSDVANPKIAWQKILALHATGDLWLWSDADIIAPAGFLKTARADFGRHGESMMTFPYVVRKIPSPPALLEALFVNAEFYPGVLLLRQKGPVDFGLGAAMLFRRDDFYQRIDWYELGATLADDFFLGQELGPVRIGQTALETVAASPSWATALAHDYRWAKTIRWNRPMGAFSRILILPIFGWLAAVILHPSHLVVWVGLAALIQVEACFAMAICHRVGCRAIFRHALALEAWSLWRALLWLISWLPWPITWSGQEWRQPRMELNSSEEARVGTH